MPGTLLVVKSTSMGAGNSFRAQSRRASRGQCGRHHYDLVSAIVNNDVRATFIGHPRVKALPACRRFPVTIFATEGRPRKASLGLAGIHLSRLSGEMQASADVACRIDAGADNIPQCQANLVERNTQR